VPPPVVGWRNIAGKRKSLVWDAGGEKKKKLISKRGTSEWARGGVGGEGLTSWCRCPLHSSYGGKESLLPQTQKS